MWFVNEVIGADVFVAAGDGRVATVVAEQPPTSRAPADYGALRVNADGEIERVFFGDNPRTVIVPFKGGH